MVVRLKDLRPKVWIFKHDGMTFEFASLDAAISYVRGYKSVPVESKIRFFPTLVERVDCPFEEDALLNAA